MRVIWTESTADDLTAIVDFISLDDPAAGRHVAKEIFDKIMSPVDAPYRGRKRSADESREIVFAPWPYVAIYRIDEDKIFAQHVRHTARLWP